jgi:hypothetical protein
MTENVVKFLPARGARRTRRDAQVADEVGDDRAAMARIVFLAERISDIIDEIDQISVQDRQSLLWHASLIRELAVDRKGGITPLCSLPRFPRDDPGAA